MISTRGRPSGEVPLIESVRRHLQHHVRFYLSAVVGIAVWQAAEGLGMRLSGIVAGDAFAVVYLAAMARFGARLTTTDLRRRSGGEDEGIVLIVLIAATAIAFSLASIFALLNQPTRPDTLRLAFSIASVPLGWLMLHTIAAFHYAHLFYTQSAHKGEPRRDAGGLAFPDTPQPTVADFLYFSFVIGMTAQVSDVEVLATSMRKLILAHSVVSFFYNTVLLAMAVNVAVVVAP